MKLPTLEDFLKEDFFVDHSYIDEPGFSSLYLRKSSRYIVCQGEMKWYEAVLQIANCNVNEGREGQGIFTNFVKRVEQLWHGPVYVEQVLSERFAAGLVRMGFQPVDSQFDWDITPRNFAKHLEAGRSQTISSRKHETRTRNTDFLM